MNSTLFVLSAAFVLSGFALFSSPESLDPAASGLAIEAVEASTATPAMSRPERLTEGALMSLTALVPIQSHTAALRYAFEAYYNFRELHPEKVRKPYLYFVDFGLPSTVARGYVFDMDRLAVVEGPFMVAHGRGSLRDATGIPERFSNRNGSNTTSLGLYVAAETYQFSGKSSGRSYRSVGLRLDGMSGGFNGAARKRGIVAHGAPYVTSTRAGRSEGCPAMEPERAQRLLPLLADGSVVFHFSPNDVEWMEMDPWVHNKLKPLFTNLEIASFL